MHVRDPIFALPAGGQSRTYKRGQPTWVSPMLATLFVHPFSNDQWIFESKLDGIRCLSIRNKTGIQLFSRNRTPLNQAYPELLEPPAAQPFQNYIVDGEIVAFRTLRPGKCCVKHSSEDQRRPQSCQKILND
jgi:ATP-dependent DNA ligase